MSDPSLQTVVRHIRRLTGRPLDAASADHELLHTFCRMRDELAFAALLRRHGPMVRDVCRRLLGRDSETDDAVQAVFLVLARRADTIRNRQSLASWLYGVAYRVCQRARRETVRRRQRETRAAKPLECDPAKEAAWRELCATLDVELIRLPEKYRAPLVHCYLQGQTHDHAAQELGLSLRTLDRRLEHGRAMLRRRLERCGLTLSATLLIVALSQRSVQAAWAAPLFHATLQAALKISAGAHLACGEISLGATGLMEGILRSLFLTQLRFVAVLVLAAAVGTGAASLVLRAASGQRERQKVHAQPPITAAAPQANAESLEHTDLFGDPLPPGAIARLGSVRWRIQGELADCMIVTPNGKQLVTADRKTGVALWNMADGVEHARIPDAPTRKEWFPAQSIALSGDGHRAAIADNKFTVHVLDLPSGAEIAARKCDAVVQELALSGNGALLASRSRDGVLLLWDINQDQGPSQGTLQQLREPWRVGQKESRKDESRLMDPFPNGELAFSPDGKLFAWVGREEGLPVHVYDTAKRQELFALGNYQGIQRYITFSPDGSKLASLSNESQGEVWDIAARQAILSLPKGWGNVPPFAAFSPDSKALALKVPADSIYILEIPSGGQRWRVKTNVISSNRQAVLAFTPDGRTLLVNAYEPVVYRYDAAEGHRLLQAREESGNFLQLAFSQNGENVYSLGADSTLRQWEAASGKEIRKTPVNVGYGVFSHDGRFTAVGSGVETRVYNTETGNERWRSPDNSVHCFSNDGKLLALSNGTDLVVRHTDSGKELQRMRGATTFAFRAAFSPDGRQVYYVNEANSSNRPSRMHVWDVGSGRELRSIALPPNGGFSGLSPDGRMFAFQRGSDGTRDSGSIEVWEILSAQKRLVLERPKIFPVRLGFTPDGNYIVSPDFADGDLKFYDLGTGKIHHRLAGYPNSISFWTFSQNGKRLATAPYDTTALIWDLTAPPAQSSSVIQPTADPGSLWNDLASTDAANAYQAVRAMTNASERTLPFLAEHLLPAPAGDEKKITAWISQLDSDRFATRQQAAKELEKCGEAARPLLERAQESKPSLEASQRIRLILTTLNQSPDLLRSLRAVEVLEHIATPAARRILQRLAQGQRQATLTEEATAALERLR